MIDVRAVRPLQTGLNDLLELHFNTCHDMLPASPQLGTELG